MSAPASVWLCGGLDPTGGAGVLRDALTFDLLFPEQDYACLVTAMTVQGDGRPARTYALPLEHLIATIDRLSPPKVVKIGLVDHAAATVLLTKLAKHPAALLVVDPVLAASDGGRLAAPEPALESLWQRADLLTPNFEEGLRLINADHADTQEVLQDLKLRYPRAAILLKGGHDLSDRLTVTDSLSSGAGTWSWTRPRQGGPDPRGTGCALASAIVGYLALGNDLAAAVQMSIVWLDDARHNLKRGREGRWHLPTRMSAQSNDV